MLTTAEVVVRGVTKPNPNKLEVRWVGEKGRGLFTRELIRAHSFICEYKVAKSRPPYPRRQWLAIEREYQQSGEGCYILEARDNEGRWWCFAATHRLNQYGRYINHAPGSMANATPAPPVLVEGRLRVGFVATQNIGPGTKITWDYGVRGEPWLCKPGKTLLTLKLCSLASCTL